VARLARDAPESASQIRGEAHFSSFKVIAGSEFDVQQGLSGLKRLMNEVIKPTARKLGIPEVGWKMLRRWNSTVMNEEHFSDRVRQTRLGHASPIVTNEHYTVVRDSVSRRAAEAIDRRLEESRKNSSKNVGTPEAVGV